VGYDSRNHQYGKLILTTTQQALGLRPVITENQTADKVEFGRQGQGLMNVLKPRWIVIDEVSMLAWPGLKQLAKGAADVGCKVLILGDPNQLPPVQAQEIKWDKILNRRELTQIMRQSGDSMVPEFGRLILNGGDWRGMRGEGLRRETRAIDAFLDEVGVPTANEEERSVFIAYRNRKVDAVQEAACQRVYGHSATEFAAGEIVISQSAFFGRSGMIVANQDQLEIMEIGGEGRWGRRVQVRNLSNGLVVWLEYLSGADMNDRGHPYVVALEGMRQEAMALQTEFKKTKDQGVDQLRRAAWAKFFDLKDRTVLNFAHAFALTSHKSQGSSYRRAYIAAEELAQFDRRSLYVAATRPREELVY